MCMGTPARMRPAMWSCGPPEDCLQHRPGSCPTSPYPYSSDCPIFHRLWNPEPGSQPPQDPPRRHGRPGRPAYGAWVAHSTPAESSAEDDGTWGEGPTPPGTPAHSTGGPHRAEPTGPPLDTPDTLTATEETGPPSSQISSRLQDWDHVLAHDGQVRESVSCLPHPQFSTRGGLLLVTEQLVVPRPYISKVLFMAHLLGAHLGMDKTRDRVLDRFYWPGVKRDVVQYCHPLIPMPIIEVPFDPVALDIVGPLLKTSRGHRYI